MIPNDKGARNIISDFTVLHCHDRDSFSFDFIGMSEVFNCVKDPRLALPR